MCLMEKTEVAFSDDTETGVIDSVMRQTVAWVREEGTMARKKPVPVSHFVNGLGVATKVIDLLIEQRREAMLLLVAEGVLPERVMRAYEPAEGEGDDAVAELYPIDRDEFLLACEGVNEKAQAMFEAEREVGDSSWYNIGQDRRRSYKRKVILGEAGE